MSTDRNRFSYGIGTPLARGPMGGDQFTQIHNGVFRDTRLTGNAMAVFGHLSTHQPGWEVTPESIARSMNNGRDAVRTALRLLEKHHYLIRTQLRHRDGTLGRTVYFYTDLPAQIRALGITDDTTIRDRVLDAFHQWKQQEHWSSPEADFQPPGTTWNDTEPPQVITGSGFSAPGVPSSNEVFSQVTTGGGSSADGQTPRKNTNGKNTNPRKTKKNTTPSLHPSIFVCGPHSKEEEEVVTAETGASSVAADPAQSSDTGNHHTAAEKLLTGLTGIWTLTHPAVNTLTPLVASKLAHGWGVEQLRMFLTHDGASVRNPAGVLQHRLTQQIPPQPPEPAAPPVCSEHPHDRARTGSGGAAVCPTCRAEVITVVPKSRLKQLEQAGHPIAGGPDTIIAAASSNVA